MYRFVLLFLACIPALASADGLLPDWNVQCTSDRAKCWIELLVPFAGPKKQERGGIAVAYDNAAKQPMYITVFVPRDAWDKEEVIINFVDSVADGDSWKLEAAETGMMGLPINECDRQFCMARIYPKIDNGDGTSTDLFAELQKRSFLWVMFKRSRKPERFMIPLSTFPAALVKVSSEPGESNQPLHPTPSAAEAPASGAGERRR